MSTLGEIHRENYKEIEYSIHTAFNALEIESIHRVYTIGDGDSYHACVSAEMSFNQFAKIRNSPMSAMHFLEYGADYIQANFPNDTLIVGVSASGGSSRVVQALERARTVSDKLQITSLVGKVESLVAASADKVISVQLPELGRSPGIRTYTASLMGLISLAIRIGEIKGNYHMNEANAMRKEIIDMGDMVDDTVKASIEVSKKAAEVCKNAPFISYTGSGPSLGSAMFCSAKVIEACGIFSAAQDLEEWAHVERFAYPLDFPVFIVAPPGKSYWRALELAKGVKILGHPLMIVVEEGDKEIAEYADFVFPVKGKIREAFSSLLYYQAGTVFSYYLAEKLGRNMFMTDNVEVMKVREELQKQIRG
ncbi:MAG TPA: SIS domain-containing protein [Anaerolineae bacterium]|nr:SIS domain-containing protein [Anaerolineae bacterium]